MKRSFAVLLGLGVASLLPAEEKPADPVAAKLTKVKAAYAAELAKIDKEVQDAYSKFEAFARKKGDKATLDRIKPELVAYEVTGALPKWASPAVPKKRTAARAPLEAAYAQQIRDYTKANQDELAAAAQKELDRLKARAVPVQYFTAANVKSGLVLGAAKDTADRGMGLVQAKDAAKPHQQWSFVPTGNPVVYLVQNRRSGLYLNVGGPERNGLQLTLWSFDAAEHNHVVVTKEGAHYQFRNGNAELYLATAEASLDEDKPVVQVPKGKGDEQFWTLTPVAP